jgi:hypothetical protein
LLAYSMIDSVALAPAIASFGVVAPRIASTRAHWKSL